MDEISDGSPPSTALLELPELSVLGDAPMAVVRGVTVALAGLPALAEGARYTLGGAALRLSSGGLLAPLQGTTVDGGGGCAQESPGRPPRWLCSSIVLIASHDSGASWSYRGRVDWGKPPRSCWHLGCILPRVQQQYDRCGQGWETRP
eukprot:COSAG04_NODE_139_length_23663_cov_6.466893_12_plen_148_part_00